MKEPVITVVVPIYNVEKYLERCVDSILAQTFQDIEVILVDDGSPDNCAALCDEYARKDTRVRVIHKENGGLSDARNAGMDTAKGEYLCFIDSDDFIDPEMLQILYQLLTDNQADISICGVRNCFESGAYEQCPDERQFVLSGEEALKQTLMGRELAGTICNKLIRRGLCREHRFIKGRTYEDAFFMPELLLQAKTVAVTTKSFYNYWHRSGSITTKPFTERNMDVVDAYSYTLQVVRECCPELTDVAMFRLYWANFVVLDKILATEDYQKLPQFKPVKDFLRKNWIKVLSCHYFRFSRRVAAVALKVNVSLYRFLAIGNMRKYRANDL